MIRATVPQDNRYKDRGPKFELHNIANTDDTLTERRARLPETIRERGDGRPADAALPDARRITRPPKNL